MGWDLSGKLVVRSDLIVEEIDGEMLLLDLEENAYFGLNAVGQQLWQWLEIPIDVDGLTQRLVEQYEVSEDEARRDVEEFVRALAERDLLATK